MKTFPSFVKSFGVDMHGVRGLNLSVTRVVFSYIIIIYVSREVFAAVYLSIPLWDVMHHAVTSQKKGILDYSLVY